MKATSFHVLVTLLWGVVVNSFQHSNRHHMFGRSPLFGKSSNNEKNVSPPRRKIGTRKRNAQQENSGFGRVSVYCVGAGIDLPALCAHVFRRSFGNNTIYLEGEKPELVLTRGATGVPDKIDDEVLHVSNSPLFISANDTYRRISATDFSEGPWNPGDTALGRGSNEAEDDENLSESSAEKFWKAREAVLMATQDIFYFEYGCVVFWGLTPREERAAMTELKPFTIDPVSPSELDDSYDTMEFSFDMKANPQRPIRFDRMRLRSLMVEEKLALSYAMAQSSKLFVFEAKVFKSVESTRYLPKELASRGKIAASKKELNQLIGQLFVQQTEVNLFSSILDTPDFLWDDDEYLPAYSYTRSYLEVDDRVTLLNSRLGVIRDLLDVITAQVADNNSARLEWIVIWLISVEIIMGIMSNPLFAGKRVLASLLVPSAVLAYKKIGWSGFQ